MGARLVPLVVHRLQQHPRQGRGPAVAILKADHCPGRHQPLPTTLNLVSPGQLGRACSHDPALHLHLITADRGYEILDLVTNRRQHQAQVLKLHRPLAQRKTRVGQCVETGLIQPVQLVGVVHVAQVIKFVTLDAMRIWEGAAL